MTRSKRNHHADDEITECGSSQKCLLKFTKNPMEKKREIVFPNCSSDDRLASKFHDFFMRSLR